MCFFRFHSPELNKLGYYHQLNPMQEINPIKNKIADLKSRGNALRGYL
ncbi:hypothetical protein METHB2_10098 [Candidatus Methylobacter favarea]|uniref:Uncharacterized protein n=1 Tax=Candidatus Methylobacter favarea TaxID=2707345 RepID=A0A8S0Y5K1_9GAMM|nr:hypothetical protein METHB2_10098 [Candidatus Methylobacter favarea]